MLIKLSSKGQLVIPQTIRQALALEPGDQLMVEVVEQQIVLKPIKERSPVDWLFGRFENSSMLDELEQEHREEIDGIPVSS